LVISNDVRKKGFNSVGYSFSDELKNDITEGYRPIIFRRGRGFVFRSKGYVSVVVLAEIIPIIKDVKTNGSDVSSNNGLIMLVEFGRETMRARSC
jgi:hypothetical protein